MENAAYIYSIENKVNGNCYIGSTINYKSRWRDHKTTLRHGRHHSFILQKAWDKYGENNFEFKLLLICEKKDKIDYENRCMKLQSYNVLRTAREKLVRVGYKHSEDHKKKLSSMYKGRKISEEQKILISKALIGKKHTEEFKEKCKKRQLGKVFSKESKEKLKASAIKARENEVKNNNSLASIIYKSYDGTVNIKNLCHKNGMKYTTFYNAIKRLGLPNLKHGAL